MPGLYNTVRYSPAAKRRRRLFLEASDDSVVVSSSLPDCAFGGFPLHLPVRL